MAFQLPDLPYSKDALAPHMSAETLEYHHGKHHKAYVNKTNELIQNEADLSGASLLQVVKEAKRGGNNKLFNNSAQLWNHSFFWQCLAPSQGQQPSGKNFVGTGPFGPWLVTPDEIGDPTRLKLETRVNGAVVQSSDTSMLIFSIPRLIEYCSTIFDLVPGDVIATGTPAGVGFTRKPPVFLKPGDLVEVEIENIGVLSNPVVDEA